MDNIRFDINATDKSKPAFDSLRSSTSKTDASVKQFDRNFSEMTGRILASAPAFAVATAAIAGVYEALRLVRDELTTGFNAVEEYRQNVIQMAAIMTTFSQKAKEGDIAGAWKEASAYAKVLVSDLEIIDVKSLASGQNIIDMTRTMMTYGVQINTNIEAQRDALVALSNAIAISTSGQPNQNLQYVQEIRGLMEGVNRTGNVLVAILERAGVNVKQFAADMQSGRKSVADLLPYLTGFMSASEEIEYSWGSIKSSLETTNKRVLRDGFLPVYRDILDGANKLKATFMDQNGQLTEQGRLVQEVIASGWGAVKANIAPVADVLAEIAKSSASIKGIADGLGGAGDYGLIGYILYKGSKGWGSVAASLLVINEFFSHLSNVTPKFDFFEVQDNSVSGLIAKYKEFAESIDNISGVGVAGGSSWWGNNKLDIYRQIFGKNSAVAIKEELNQISAALEDFYGSSSAGQVNPPTMAPPPMSDEDKKAYDTAIKNLQKLRDEFTKTQDTLAREVALGGLTGLTKELKQLEFERADVVEKFKGFDTSGIDRFYEELAGQKKAEAVAKVREELIKWNKEADKTAAEALEKDWKVLESLNAAVSSEQDKITEKYRELDRQLTDLVSSGRLSFDEAVKIDFGLQNAMQAEMAGLYNTVDMGMKQVQTVSETVSGRLEDGFVTAFENISTGAKDMGEVVNDVLQDIVNEIFRTQAVQPLLAAAGSSLFGINGVFSRITGNYGPVKTMHSGGIVGIDGKTSMQPTALWNNAPRYHLGNDEYRAILQRGEVVVPADKAAAVSGGGSYYITIMAADAQSFSDMVKRNPQSVIAPFREALQRGDKGLRSDIQRATQ